MKVDSEIEGGRKKSSWSRRKEAQDNRLVEQDAFWGGIRRNKHGQNWGNFGRQRNGFINTQNVKGKENLYPGEGSSTERNGTANKSEKQRSGMEDCLKEGCDVKKAQRLKRWGR